MKSVLPFAPLLLLPILTFQVPSLAQVVFSARNGTVDVEAIAGNLTPMQAQASSLDLNAFNANFSLNNPGDPQQDFASRKASVWISTFFSSASFHSAFHGAESQGTQNGAAGGLAFSQVQDSFAFHLDKATPYTLTVNFTSGTPSQASLSMDFQLSQNSVAIASSSSPNFANLFSGTLQPGDYSLSYSGSVTGSGFPSSANYAGDILLIVPEPRHASLAFAGVLLAYAGWRKRHTATHSM